MRPIGFSTGAIAKGGFLRALAQLREHHIQVVELSALRIEELQPLCSTFASLDLSDFTFVSLHAPSRFPRDMEASVVDQLRDVAHFNIPIVVHPDTLYTPPLWRRLGEFLLVENLDKRKPIGRTVAELRPVFENLPEARFCFDIGHARQVDPSMTEAAALLRAFGRRLAEVHLSEVNTASRHDPISLNAVRAFRAVASLIPEKTPIVLETLIDQGQSTIDLEMERARESLPVLAVVGL